MGPVDLGAGARMRVAEARRIDAGLPAGQGALIVRLAGLAAVAGLFVAGGVLALVLYVRGL